MKLLFIHSGEKIKRDDRGQLYTDGSYSADIWARYLAIADQLTLLMRCDPTVYSEKEARVRFNPIPNERIECRFMPDQNRNIRARISPWERHRLNCILREEIARHDAVIIRLPGTGQAVRMARQADKPCLVEMVGCPWDALWNHSWQGKLLALGWMWQTKCAVKQAPAVIYVTDTFLQKRYPTKGVSVGCSDVMMQTCNRDVLEKRLSKLNGATERCVLGTVAAVDAPYKGQRDVIAALGKLKRCGITHFEYQLVGGGDQTYLRSLAKKYHVEEQVHFLGSIPHDRVFDWLDEIDLYIQPSKQEGLPRALLEAMSRALPAIGSHVGGIPELLPSEAIFQGSVCRANKIARMLRSIDRRKLSEQAKQNYEKSLEYDHDILEKRRSAFYRRCFFGES